MITPISIRETLERLPRWQVEINERREGFMRHRSNHQVTDRWFREAIVDYDFWFISEGTAWLESASGEKHFLQRGSLVFLRPGQCRRMWQEKGAGRIALYWFHFNLCEAISDEPVPPEETSAFPLVTNCYNTETAERLCMEMLHLGIRAKGIVPMQKRVRQAMTGEILKSLLFQFLLASNNASIGTAPSNTKMYRDILGLMDVIEMNPARFSSVQEMSTGLARSYFTRIFTKIAGKPPKTFLIEARIKKAKQFLNGSNLSINQIAGELGYQNIYFFYRQFKKQTGMTPMEFRTRNA